MAKINIGKKKLTYIDWLRAGADVFLRLLAFGYFVAAAWNFKDKPMNGIYYLGVANFYLLSWFASKFL